MMGFLMNREYDKDEVQMQIDKATGLDRATRLQSMKFKTSLDRVPLITRGKKFAVKIDYN